jgi:hypothetical protein
LPATIRRYAPTDDAIRATFLIDKNGTIVDQFQTDSLGTARDPARDAAALAKL